MVNESITKSNPSFLTEDELVRIFVGRHVDLNMIMETIKENMTDSNQHILLTGPRGMGKTMLILRIVASVRNDEKLASTWYPIVFGEESYEVSTAGQFWLRSLFHLGEQTNIQYWRDIYRDLLNNEDEKNLHDRALSSLMEFADEQGKRILLVVENLDLLFGEQIGSTDMWTIRHTLQNDSRLMLLGTATDRFNEVDKIGGPLFELFKIHELEPLKVEDCQAFWKAVTGHSIEYKKMRPIQILTGGNPRLLAIISSFTMGDTFRELMKNLTFLVDEYTSNFKSATESLPPTERKVFAILAGIWEPATASQVAAEARISVSESSALLNRLVSRGAVTPVKVKGRKKSYQVAERLYNIYYLMRRSHRPSDRVKAIVRFMEHFYEGEEPALKMSSLTAKVFNLGHEVRQDYFHSYREILSAVGNESDVHQIIKSTPHEFFNLPDFDINVLQVIYQPKYQVEIDTKRSDLDIKSVGTDQEESLRGKLEKTPDEPRLGGDLGQLLYEKLESYVGAEEAYYRVAKINPKSDWPWSKLGQLLHEKLKRYEDAEKAYRNAIEINPKSDWAWAHLGQLLHEKLERYEDAEEAYRKAVEIEPKYDWAWAQLGQLLHEKLERYEDAEEAYRKAVEIEPKYDWAWAQLGQLLHEKLERYEEAEEAYRKVVEIYPEYDWAWAQLGQLLHEKLERYEDAEEAYRKAVEIEPKYDWVWAYLGQLLHEKLGRYEEAEEAYRQAIEIDPNSNWVLAHLGQLLHEKLERYEEAEEAYRKAVEINPKYDWAWLKLGQLLYEKLERYEEAEEAYRKAIEINPEYDWPWVNLGLLFHTRLNRFTEAEEAYRKAAEIDPNKSVIWIALGVLLYYELERFEEAEESFNNALRAEASNTVALELLIRVKIRLSAPHELIFETIDRYIEVEGRTDLSLNYMAWLIYETGFRAGFSYAEKLVREAVEITPGSPYFQHTLASIIGAQGRWMEALKIAPSFLISATMAENFTNDLVSFFSNAAIAGFAKEGLYILKDTLSAPIVEPLIVALQMLTEEEYNAPREVVEIAIDIVNEMERKKESQ